MQRKAAKHSTARENHSDELWRAEKKGSGRVTPQTRGSSPHPATAMIEAPLCNDSLSLSLDAPVPRIGESPDLLEGNAMSVVSGSGSEASDIWTRTDSSSPRCGNDMSAVEIDEGAAIGSSERAEETTRNGSGADAEVGKFVRKDVIVGAALQGEVTASSTFTLEEPVDPKEFNPVAWLMCTPSEARALCTVETCAACGSAGNDPLSQGAADASLVHCSDCGEGFHPFCLPEMVPLKSMDPLTRLGWRCVNCKVCEVCLAVEEEVVGDNSAEMTLLYCELCDRAYHLKCLTPSLPSVPSGHFLCGLCVDCAICDETLFSSSGSEIFSSPSSLAPHRLKSGRWSSRPDRCLECAFRFTSRFTQTCPVCQSLWGDDEGGMAQCEGCGTWVHAHCDDYAYRAVHVSSTGVETVADTRLNRYFCPYCVLNPHSTPHFGPASLGRQGGHLKNIGKGGRLQAGEGRKEAAVEEMERAARRAARKRAKQAISAAKQKQAAAHREAKAAARLKCAAALSRAEQSDHVRQKMEARATQAHAVAAEASSVAMAARHRAKVAADDVVRYKLTFYEEKLGMGVQAAEDERNLPVISFVEQHGPGKAAIGDYIEAVEGRGLLGHSDPKSEAVRLIQSLGRPITVTMKIALFLDFDFPHCSHITLPPTSCAQLTFVAEASWRRATSEAKTASSQNLVAQDRTKEAAGLQRAIEELPRQPWPTLVSDDDEEGVSLDGNVSSDLSSSSDDCEGGGINGRSEEEDTFPKTTHRGTGNNEAGGKFGCFSVFEEEQRASALAWQLAVTVAAVQRRRLSLAISDGGGHLAAMVPASWGYCRPPPRDFIFASAAVDGMGENPDLTPPAIEPVEKRPMKSRSARREGGARLNGSKRSRKSERDVYKRIASKQGDSEGHCNNEVINSLSGHLPSVCLPLSLASFSLLQGEPMAYLCSEAEGSAASYSRGPFRTKTPQQAVPTVRVAGTDAGVGSSAPAPTPTPGDTPALRAHEDTSTSTTAPVSSLTPDTRVTFAGASELGKKRELATDTAHESSIKDNSRNHSLRWANLPHHVGNLSLPLFSTQQLGIFGNGEVPCAPVGWFEPRLVSAAASMAPVRRCLEEAQGALDKLGASTSAFLLQLVGSENDFEINLGTGSTSGQHGHELNHHQGESYVRSDDEGTDMTGCDIGDHPDIVDTRICILCRGPGDKHAPFGVPCGRLLPFNMQPSASGLQHGGLWCHTQCALWSSETGEVAGGVVRAFSAALRRGRLLKCSHCGEPGATMGCCFKNCKENFHFPCGHAAGAALLKNTQVFCRFHLRTVGLLSIDTKKPFPESSPTHTNQDENTLRGGVLDKCAIMREREVGDSAGRETADDEPSTTLRMLRDQSTSKGADTVLVSEHLAPPVEAMAARDCQNACGTQFRAKTPQKAVAERTAVLEKDSKDAPLLLQLQAQHSAAPAAASHELSESSELFTSATDSHGARQCEDCEGNHNGTSDSGRFCGQRCRSANNGQNQDNGGRSETASVQQMSQPALGLMESGRFLVGAGTRALTEVVAPEEVREELRPLFLEQRPLLLEDEIAQAAANKAAEAVASNTAAPGARGSHGGRWGRTTSTMDAGSAPPTTGDNLTVDSGWAAVRIGALTVHALGDFPDSAAFHAAAATTDCWRQQRNSVTPGVSVLSDTESDDDCPSPGNIPAKTEAKVIQETSGIEGWFEEEECAGTPWFHSKERLYPRGFRSTRLYWSRVDPLRRTMYVNDVFEVPLDVARALAKHLNRSEVVRWKAALKMRSDANGTCTPLGPQRRVSTGVPGQQQGSGTRLITPARCKSCARPHNGSYGSGRFCNLQCRTLHSQENITFACNSAVLPSGPYLGRRYRSFIEPVEHNETRTFVAKICVFRITALDDLANPVLGFTAEQCYHKLFDEISVSRRTALLGLVRKQCARTESGSGESGGSAMRQLEAKVSGTRTAFLSFGLTASQWFGFGVGLVQRRLEKMPQVASLAVLTPSQSSYQYRFVLPEPEDFLVARRALVAADARIKPNPSGAARSESRAVVASATAKSKRVTRALHDGGIGSSTVKPVTRTKTAGVVVSSDAPLDGNGASRSGLHLKGDEVDVREIVAMAKMYVDHILALASIY